MKVTIVEAGFIFAIVIIGITGLINFYIGLQQVASLPPGTTGQISLNFDPWTVMTCVSQWLCVIVLLIIAIELEYLRKGVAPKRRRR